MNKIASLSGIDAAALPHELVSFDLFDTLIYRRYLQANEVHDLVSAYALARFGRHAAELPGAMTLARYTATNNLKMSPVSPREEPALRLVWERLAEARIGPGPRARAIAEAVADFEYEVDSQNLYAVEGAAEMLQALRDAGKRIVAVSDMYFTQAEVEGLLERAGLLPLFDRVFVSADIGLTKQTGRLFDHVCREMGVEPAQVVHFGDNMRSDVEVPRRLGLDAVHVDHHGLLKLDRPRYGQRGDIHLEIADLIKLFGAQVLFHAVSDASDQLYFLSRDGCLINRVLQAWDQPLLTRFFGGIGLQDLFLSRAVSCWLNVNFQGEWLLQAIGHAFWLHHGEATASQLSSILGIAAVPPSLGDAVYTSNDHSFVVLEAYRDAGLADAIRASLLEKRAQVARYLNDTGFFAHDSVILCDVGYSGTVVRDLNTFFLQEALDHPGRRVPRINFHCIASNGNYGNNAMASLPHVHFSERVPLPVTQMPSSLAESFAWLEMFFKHPTYGPLLGYREVDGRMVPDFEEAGEAEAGHPAARVVAQSGGRPADIVLLWMAAIHFWGQLTDPLLRRFADPDDDTVEQMLDDVYEVDAVSGVTRSVVLIAPELSDEQIHARAREKDYWIPGSIAASRRARRMQAREPLRLVQPQSGSPSGSKSDAGRDGGRFQALLRRFAPPDRWLDRFDPVFYRAFYADLRALPNAEALRQHYAEHGRFVGRYGSEAEMRSVLLDGHGTLPDGFDYGAYLLGNPDLVVQDPARWHAEAHYLRHGRAEGRSYMPPPNALDREFDRLAASGALALSPAERARWDAGASVRALVFKRHGVGSGPWLDALDLTEFAALNAAWCGPLASKAAAVEAFLREGLDRLAPLSLEAAFDAEFYRSQYPQTGALEDRAAYRHWIETGSLLGFVPCESYRLTRMIGMRDFPAAFRWDIFRDRHKHRLPSGASRSDLLQSFLDWGDPHRDDVVQGEGAAALWEVFAVRAAQRGDQDAAAAAYRKAIAAGGSAGRIWHQLADLHRGEGRLHEALDGYRRAVAGASPDRWSYINGTLIASELGVYEAGLSFLEKGQALWRDMEPWRRARATLFSRWIDSVETRISAPRLAPEPAPMAASSRPAIRDRDPDAERADLVATIAAAASRTLPSGLDLRRERGPVVVLAGTGLDQRALWAAGVGDAARDGRRVLVYGRNAVRLFVESLPGASVAILHEVALDAPVLDAVLTARGYGVPTLFWAGEFGSHDGLSLDLSELAWSDFMRHGGAPACGDTLASFQIAAFCDACVTTAPSMVPALSRLRPGAVSLGASATLRALAEAPRTPREGCDFRLLIAWRSPGADEETAFTEAVLLARIGALLSRHNRLHVLVVGLTPDHALSAHGARLTVLDAGMTAAQRAVVTASVDAVAELGGRGGFASFWADAAFHALPAIVEDRPATFGRLRPPAAEHVADAAALDAAVERLIEARAEVAGLGDAARAALDGMLAFKAVLPPAAPARRKTSILYVNIFAPPQVIGGATRVLADNLETMLDHGLDRYDVSILAADEENDDRGATRCDSWRGVPVFRIATPQEIDMDWRMHNAEVAAYARRVLDLVQPDLVHIHCLTRLSVAVAEVCRAMGRAYVITLHDGWWLSDYAFLVDEIGRPARIDAYPTLQAYSERIGLPRSLERALRLRAALHGAQALLAVSEPFARLYREAGFPARTIANGVSGLKVPPRVPGHGRVRLGHVGGTQHHKGVYLIESVLRMHRFENLSFTMIELARDPGDESHTVWGNTPVTILGKYPASRIGEVYARLDVLLAPSTWPESFGLVAREAAQAGLWVVATDQGAMGEDVVDGENGFRIDTTSPEGLLRALRLIDADPERFMAPPSRAPSLRGAADQGRELMAFYGTLLDADAGAAARLA